MPSIEFMDEIEALKKQVEETESSARMYCERTLKAEARADKAEASLAALKKDARMCADFVDCDGNGTKEEHEAARRILESTEAENE
jgi:hypothetical protein